MNNKSIFNLQLTKRKPDLKLTFFAAFFTLCSALVFSQENYVKFSTKDIENNSVTNSIFKNSKVTMVNVWGTFCPPCIAEMPDLGKLSKTYSKNDFQIIGIVIDVLDRKGNPDSKTIANAKSIVKKTGADYLHLIPNGELIEGLLKDIYAVPTTFFIDSDGKIIGKEFLGSKSFNDWKKIIDENLAKK